MSSFESGRIGPKLVSSPNPQPDESPESICYCPDCGARVRLVTREPDARANRGTLPDWLPTNAAPTPTPCGASAEPPTPVVLPVSAEAEAPTHDTLPLLTTRPPLPELPSFALLPPLTTSIVGRDDEDEPTRVIADYGVVSGLSTDPASESPEMQVQAHSAPIPSAPPEAADITAAVAASSSTALASPAMASATLDEAHPLPSPPAIESLPPAKDYIGVQSTSPTARDLSVETSETNAWQRHPWRKGLLVSVGLGGCAVALGFALSVRGPSAERTPAAAAIPVAAVTASPIQSTTTEPVAPPATEPTEQPVSTVSAKAPTPKAQVAAQREIQRSDSRIAKATVAQPTKPVSPEPKDESADVDEEEPFDAREAAQALDEAAERASACRRENDPSGVALVTITFAPSGRVTTATLAGPPFLGTPTGSCIASTMRSARVTAFGGTHMTVRKTVTIH